MWHANFTHLIHLCPEISRAIDQFHICLLIYYYSIKMLSTENLESLLLVFRKFTGRIDEGIDKELDGQAESIKALVLIRSNQYPSLCMLLSLQVLTNPSAVQWDMIKTNRRLISSCGCSSQKWFSSLSSGWKRWLFLVQWKLQIRKFNT